MHRCSFAGAATASQVVIASLGLSVLLCAALAQESAAPLTVSTVVEPRCMLGVIDSVDFGDIPTSADDPVTRGFSITVTCISGSHYTLSLDGGLHRSEGMRRMAKGASAIAYRIFDGDSLGSEVGDAGIDDTYPFSPLTAVGDGAARFHGFSATAYPGSAESAITDTGIHSDTVTVKVTY